MSTINQEPLLESYESPKPKKEISSLGTLRNSCKEKQQTIENLKISIENKKLNIKQIQLNINFQIQKQVSGLRKNTSNVKIRQIFSKNNQRSNESICNLQEQLQKLRKSITSQKTLLKNSKKQIIDTGIIALQDNGSQLGKELYDKQVRLSKLQLQKKTLQVHLHRIENAFPSKEKQQQLDQQQKKLSLQLKELINNIKQKKIELKKLQQEDIRVTQKSRFIQQLLDSDKKANTSKLQNSQQIETIVEQIKYIMKEKKQIQNEKESQYKLIKKKHSDVLLAKSKIEQQIRIIDSIITQKKLQDFKDSEKRKKEKQMQQLRMKSQKQHQQKVLQRKERIDKLWQSRSYRLKQIQENLEKSKIRSSKQQQELKKPKYHINYPKISRKKSQSNLKENQDPMENNHTVQNIQDLNQDSKIQINSDQLQQKQYEQKQQEKQQIKQDNVQASRINLKTIQIGMEANQNYSLQLNDSFLGEKAKIKSIQIHHDNKVIIGVQASYYNQQKQQVDGYKVMSKIKPKKFQTELLTIQETDRIDNMKIGKNQDCIIKFICIQTKNNQKLQWGEENEGLNYEEKNIDEYEGITLMARLQSDSTGGPNSLSLSGIGFLLKATQNI